MSPTRVPVFDALYEILGDEMKMFYPTTLEGDRDKKWSVQAHHPHHLLKARSFAYTLFSMKRYVHFNPDIYSALCRFDPDCVIIYNFHPTSLLAWLYTRIHRKKFIVATDGCLKSDRKNTPFHFLLRKAIIPTAVAAVGTSKGSLDLFNLYADFTQRYFNCYLCADNARFAPFRQQPREYDVMFAGQFIERKLPHFFVDVVTEMKKIKPDVSAVLLGDGPQRQEVTSRLDALGIRYRYAGFLPREELPLVYASARVLLFPTLLDAYGVVANEALAVGTPVICNDEPGAAGEVVLNGVTGYVLPLDAKVWAERAIELLTHPERYRQISDAGFAHVQKYTFEAAAQGLKHAFSSSTLHHERSLMKMIHTPREILEIFWYRLQRVLLKQRFIPRIKHFELTDASFDFYIGDVDGMMWYGSDRALDRETLLSKHILENNDVVFDVGGHHGFTSMLFAKWGGRQVHIFEPHPKNAEIITQNIHLNALSENVNLYNLAIGECSGNLTIKDTSDSRIARNSEGGINVKVAPLDDFLYLSPTLLKIDVEGFECHVLQGARRIMETQPKLIIEVHVGGMIRYGKSVAELFGLVDWDHYDCWLLHPKGKVFPIGFHDGIDAASKLSRFHIFGIPKGNGLKAFRESANLVF